jgi:hypothetical protein
MKVLIEIWRPLGPFLTMVAKNDLATTKSFPRNGFEMMTARSFS